MIKYLGSKKRMIDSILDVVGELNLPEGAFVGDLFTGTTRVAQAFKGAGFRVISNDYLVFPYVMANYYIVSGASDQPSYALLANTLNGVAQEDKHRGYLTKTFAEKSRYFSVDNAMMMDAVWAYIKNELSGLERDCALAMLIEAADRVDSTVGLQMAYLKSPAARSLNPLEIKAMPIPEGYKGLAYCRDVTEASHLREYDLVYYDPPYNQHSYAGNYHVWETIARMDTPEVYGVACKRVDTRENKSLFNSKNSAPLAISNLIDNTTARYILFSYSNEAFLSLEDLIKTLERRGSVNTTIYDAKRHIGHKLGVYSPSGTKVGVEAHSRVSEYLVLCEVNG